MISFVEKHLSFYPKEVRSFYVFFYSNEEKLNQQVCVIKYVENEIFNSIFHKKEREEKKHTTTSKTSFPIILKNCHLLH